MKQSLLFIFSCFIFLGCNNGAKQEEPKTDSMAKKETLTYPFTAKYSLNWQPGDEKYALLVLNSIKKYVDGDVKGTFAYFADSVEFVADKFHFSGKKDSLEALFTSMRSNQVSMSFQPDTWLTAYYPDKNDTWVTVWGTQKWTDKKGKTDSVYIADDVLVKDGKIAEVDEKQRMFPEPPKKK